MRARDHQNDEYKWIGDRKKEERNNVYYNELLVDSKEYGKLRLKVGEGNLFKFFFRLPSTLYIYQPNKLF